MCKPHVIAFMQRLEARMAWAKKTRHTTKYKRLHAAYQQCGRLNGYFAQAPF